MLHNILVMIHILGASIWIGGHVVLVRVILPSAMRERDPKRILEFERSFGKIALGALALQFATGLALADTYLGGWQNLFSHPTRVSHLVLTKLTLLAITIGLAVHATIRLLPQLDLKGMRAFAIHAWIITILAILLLVVGASIRLGGLFQ